MTALHLRGPADPVTDSDGLHALIRSIDDAARLALQLTGAAEAALGRAEVEGVLKQIRRRGQVVDELGSMLARLAGIRNGSASSPVVAWDEAAELAWRPVVAVLEELGTSDASLTDKLRSARDAIAAELAGFDATDEIASAYGSGSEPRRIDRRG